MTGLRYGYGGGLARTSATGAAIKIRLKAEGSVGGRVSRLVVLFERDPRGGVLKVTRGGVELGSVDTKGPRNTSGRAVLVFPDGDEDLKIALGGGGTVRVHGVALERSGPGLVWDGLGLTGARYYSLARLPEAHFQEQLGLRPADLVVFQYGANISDLRVLPEDWYRQGVRKVLNRLKPLRDRLSCLVVGPVDRGFHWRFGLPSRPIVRDIERVQREEAISFGCAFYSSREVMGGDGSAGRWAREKPPLMWGDLTHLRPAGAQLLGQRLGGAILRAQRAWRRQNPRAACPRPAAAR
jgi:lysophospholipase L1-like esterase